MKIIFVGSVVDSKTINNLPAASVAGNKMELGFIKGFIDNGISTSVISVEPHEMWKFNDKPISVKSKKLLDGATVINTIKYINIPFLKQISAYLEIQKQLKLSKIDKNTTLFVYNTMSYFALPVIHTAKKNQCKCVAIVADLPIQYKKNIFRRIEDLIQVNLISKFDGLVVLTENIARDFAPQTPFCLVEAGCFPNECCEKNATEAKQTTHKNIVFSGTLNQLSGIELIIEAMEYLDANDFVLNIYGRGPLEDFVKNSASHSKNIVYHGRVSNDKMGAIQKNADLLVCPRVTDNYTTKYTFPSKILEYLCSGVPILANRLPGIPEEYDEYINYSHEESAESWAKAILEILINNNEFYLNKASNARNIVLEKKSWNNQCKRVIGSLIDRD